MKNITEQLDDLDAHLKSYTADNDTNYSHFEDAFCRVFHGHHGLVIAPYYKKGLNLYRARCCSNEFYNSLSELWYIPKYSVKKLNRGRFNESSQRLFYCANELDTAILELKPKPAVGDYVTILMVSITKPDLNIVQFEPRAFDYPNIWDNKRPGDKEIFEWLFLKAKQDVPGNQSQLYYPTNLFCKATQLNRYDGVCYNSVQRGLTGYNFALFPDVIDKYFKFERAFVLRMNSETKYDILYHTKEITSFGRFKF